MKKSVILIITTLSLVAIILIGLIFQRAEVYNVTVYVKDIICTSVRIGDEYYKTYLASDNYYKIENSEKPGSFLTLPYFPELTIDIIYEVRPFDASNQSVSFYTDPNSLIAKIDAETGRIVFLDEGTETFTVRANDNSNISARIKLRAKIPEA